MWLNHYCCLSSKDLGNILQTHFINGKTDMEKSFQNVTSWFWKEDKIWVLIDNRVLRCDIGRHTKTYSFTLLCCKSLVHVLPAQLSAYPTHGIFSAYNPKIYVLKLFQLWLPVGYSQKLNTKTDYLETSLQGEKKRIWFIII